jgi:hypothetical protein
MTLLQINFGTIGQPEALGNFGTVEGGAIGTLLNLVFNILIVIAGIYALFNFIFAGYHFLSAGDDPKKIEGAWAKIYQSVIGLLVAAGSLVLAAIFGQLIFGDAMFLIRPVIPTP